jgi:hypothetical protein
MRIDLVSRLVPGSEYPGIHSGHQGLASPDGN